MTQTQKKDWYQSLDWLSEVHRDCINGYILKRVNGLRPTVAYARLKELSSLVRGNKLELFFLGDNEVDYENDSIPFKIDHRTIEEIDYLKSIFLEKSTAFTKEKEKKNIEKVMSEIEGGKLTALNINRYSNWLTKKLISRERSREYLLEGKNTKSISEDDGLELLTEYKFDKEFQKRLNTYCFSRRAGK
jgi:hypothetical protein